ncbi:MAG: LPS-assembly protein LptD [Bacteroidetes bacterium]|nr:LPS-assembly protein LptD [Bacteroidota bacterium]MBS1943163.1 LPS-assembly protein LptD [Bacteroidota bacterium]
MAKQTVYLFGAATVKYQDVELTADRIKLDMAKEEVQAYGTMDSAGAAVGFPVFTQGGQKVEADSIRYNFKTKEGIIKEVRTSESQMYVLAHLSKRHANGEIHSRGGSLTTCDRPHPHYRFAVSRMMVIPDDKIVMGPAVMKIGNVPTPLAVPFGFFPNHKNRGSAGILIPTWGSSDQFGIFLLNGGYYLPISDNLDEQLTADIYSRGSWGLRSITRYKERYRFGGSLDLQYSDKLNSIREYPDFSEQRTFFIRWNHLVDPKASLTDRFNASVNVGSSQNFTNNFNSSTQDYLSNTFQSNVNWSHLWPGKPYSLSVSARHSQNTINRTFDVTLPSVNFNVQRFFPGTWLHGQFPGKPKWYDQVGVTWSTIFDNRLSTTEDQLSIENLPNLLDRMRNGVRHTGAVSTSIKTRAFTLNPQFNITDRTYFDGLRKTYDPSSSTVLADTVPGLRNVFDWSVGATATSKLYGMYAFRGGRLQAIRHVITPSASLTFLPGNDTRIFGPYGFNGSYGSYSPYDIGIYGQPSPNASGLVSLGLVQSVEAKVRSKTPDAKGDPQFTKVKLLDNLSINANYDLLKDSLRWSPVSMAARTRLLNFLDVNLASLWDPYATDSLGRNIDRPTRTVDGSLAHLRNANLALGFELQSKRYGKSNSGSNTNDQVVAEADPDKGARINFSIPWHLRVNYSYSVARAYRVAEFTEQQTQSVLFSGDLNILKYWKLGFSSGYDMQAREWTPTSLNLYWDLHCWEFNANVIPLGIRKSFTFRINVKASVLHDLKYELRKPFGNKNELLY